MICRCSGANWSRLWHRRSLVTKSPSAKDPMGWSSVFARSDFLIAVQRRSRPILGELSVVSHRCLNMGRKHTYATKAQLETLVRRMHRTGILYYEALGEFRRQFILVVLRDVN